MKKNIELVCSLAYKADSSFSFQTQGLPFPNLKPLLLSLDLSILDIFLMWGLGRDTGINNDVTAGPKYKLKSL